MSSATDALPIGPASLSPAGTSDPLSISDEVKASISLLIVDDDRTLREGCANILSLDGYKVTQSGRGDEALEMVRRRRFDIILVDLYMTPVTGMDILKSALEAHKDSIVVLMTGNPSVTSNIEALQAGAWDYLPKPFSATHLQVLVGRASHAVLVARETTEIRASTRSEHEESPADRNSLIGTSLAFRKAVELARRVAQTDASVLITGESGTGKEVIAQFIHRNSRRASRNLVAVNCAALPENLLESEMFGHRKGAFTGADRDKAGLLEVANGGTFFLDELTEMSLPLQAKLLRVIQDGVVRRVGSEQPDAVVDVRFISATNRDPQDAVQQGVLREDLFYRLRVVPIKLPPLRQRLEDIPILARHFLSTYWKRHRTSTNPVPELTKECVEFLQSRPWRGNVRELQNVVEHVAVITEAGRPIGPDDIPVYDEAPAPAAAAGSGVAQHLMNESYHSAKDQLVAHFEKEYLTRLVQRAGGNMSRAARLASIDRTTLYRLMDKHGFKRDEISGGFD